MNKLFVLNPIATKINIFDGIIDRLSKAQAITHTLTPRNNDFHNLSDEIISNALGAINTYLDEIDILQHKLIELQKQ